MSVSIPLGKKKKKSLYVSVQVLKNRKDLKARIHIVFRHFLNKLFAVKLDNSGINPR